MNLRRQDWFFFSSQIPTKKRFPHSFVTTAYFWGLLAVVLLPVYFVLCYVFNHFVNWTVILPKAFLFPPNTLRRATCLLEFNSTGVAHKGNMREIELKATSIGLAMRFCWLWIGAATPPEKLSALFFISLLACFMEYLNLSHSSAKKSNGGCGGFCRHGGYLSSES